MNTQIASQHRVSPRTELGQKLDGLASRVEQNGPHRRDPETYHAEKSEIAYELRRVIKDYEL